MRDPKNFFLGVVPVYGVVSYDTAIAKVNTKRAGQ
jgi:hypothetical protein